MKYKPHNYQKYCANRIIELPKLALWLDMGLGKTRITLTAILDLLFNRFMVSKVLIIAPKKVAENTWQREIAKWDDTRDTLRYSTVLGRRPKRIKALNTPASIYIINRDNVAWLVEYYKNAWPFDMVVIDEASSFKNHTTKRFKALRSVLSKIHRLVELTGTPAANGLTDLWAQIYLLDKGARLGAGISSFRYRWFVPDRRNGQQIYSYKPRKGAEKEIRELLSDICISMKAEDYIDLPEVITVDVPISLDPDVVKAYKTFERTLVLNVDETTLEAVSASALYGKLLQLCNGAVYDENHDYKVIHDCKLEALVEMVEALSGEHAIIYYSYQHDIERIMKALQPLNLRVAKYENAEQENAWCRGEIDILIAHPASSAYGLNLQDGGHHIIWFGLNPSLELTAQANKRLHRQGQEYPVIIHRLLIENSVEYEVSRNLANKDATENALLDSLKVYIENTKAKGASA